MTVPPRSRTATWTTVLVLQDLPPSPTTIHTQILMAYRPPGWNRRRSKSRDRRRLLQVLLVDTDEVGDGVDFKTEAGAAAAIDTMEIVVGDEGGGVVAVVTIDTLPAVGLEGKAHLSLNRLDPFHRRRLLLLELLVSVLMVPLWMHSMTPQWAWAVDGATSSTRCSRCSSRSITRLVIRFHTFSPISTLALLPTSGWQAWAWVMGHMVASLALTAPMRQDTLSGTQQGDGVAKSSGVLLHKRLRMGKAETKMHDIVDSA